MKQKNRAHYNMADLKLHAKFKSEASLLGLSINDAITDAIKDWLKKPKKTA